MEQGRIKVALAAQHAILRVAIRKTLARAPDVQIVGEAENGQQSIKLVEQLDPDVLILEIEMSVKDSILTIEQLKQNGSEVRIIMFSREDDLEIASEMKKRGVWKFLSKYEIQAKIIEAVRQAGKE